MKIENRTFIVSGGSSGLGLASVLDLLSLKAFVSILDRADPPSDMISSPRVKFFKSDITAVDEIEHAVDRTVDWTNETGAALGGVINCAGIAIAASMVDTKNLPHPLDAWDLTLAVNLTGTFNLTRIALKHMVHVQPEEGADGERGVIILVSSAAAYEGQPGTIAYAATKGAIRSMVLPLARDLSRHGIRAVAIAPSAFESSMTAQLRVKTRNGLAAQSVLFPRRFGRPNEFAQTMRWVLECPFVNGETVRLSGGGRMPGKL